MRKWLWAALMLLSTPAFAAPPGVPGSGAPSADDPSARVGESMPTDAETMAAKKVLTEYLDLVIKKKYAEARKKVHPQTLAVIAGIKKRTGAEQHPMAPEYWAKNDFRLVRYTIQGAATHRWDTRSFDVQEVDYRIQEKGEDEGTPVSYLLGQKGGTWYVVDKKVNNTFSDAAIKFDYKGYFDPAPPPPSGE
jgi:hypothetical protein